RVPSAPPMVLTGTHTEAAQSARLGVFLGRWGGSGVVEPVRPSARGRSWPVMSTGVKGLEPFRSLWDRHAIGWMLLRRIARPYVMEQRRHYAAVRRTSESRDSEVRQDLVVTARVPR